MAKCRGMLRHIFASSRGGTSIHLGHSIVRTIFCVASAALRGNPPDHDYAPYALSSPSCYGDTGRLCYTRKPPVVACREVDILWRGMYCSVLESNQIKRPWPDTDLTEMKSPWVSSRVKVGLSRHWSEKSRFPSSTIDIECMAGITTQKELRLPLMHMIPTFARCTSDFR